MWALGIVGTLLSVIGIINYFTNFLTLLGVAIPPVAGIMVVDYFILKRSRATLDASRAKGELPEKVEKWNPIAIVCWIAGFAVGEITSIMNVGIPGLNSLINLGIQAELNFTQHGWEEKFEEKPQYKYSRTVNYMELPFLTHIHFGSKRVRVFVNLGPKIGYALSESTESNLNGENPNANRPDEQHTMEVQKKFDWGLCGGPGIELRTGIGSFLLEGRYYYALGDMFNSRKGDTFSKSSSQIISAKLTYLIPIFSK